MSHDYFVDKPTERLVFDACSGRCFYCDKRLCYHNREEGERGAWNVDYIDLKEGSGVGSDEVGNLRAACLGCHEGRAGMDAGEFFTRVKGKEPRCWGYSEEGKCFCTSRVSEADGRERYCKQSHCRERP